MGSKMINSKQQELGKQLFKKLSQQFPDIKLLGISENPENQDEIWVNVDVPEEKEVEIYKVASEMSVQILLDYGYDIGIMT